MRDLQYLETWTIDEFKQAHNVSKIVVLQNNATERNFFAFGQNGRGACSQKASTGEMTNPVISQVYAEDTGKKFLLLHQKGEGGGARTIAVL